MLLTQSIFLKESSTGDTGYDSCDYIELGVPVMSIVSIASSGKPFSTMAHRKNIIILL